ncbi:hypothetical protein DBR42_16915 [Pelomonas sp. HMWF004]|nr:hypothetical protein DBR42_16915 [Pelomonas sp. HMWF004]
MTFDRRAKGLWRPFVAILVAFALYRGCSEFQSHWYEGFLPQSVDVDAAVYVGDSSGFGEGCGVAIYRLSGAYRDKLRAAGLETLGDASQARRHPERRYSDWRETPYVEPRGEAMRNPWLSGMAQGCAQWSYEIERQVSQALRSPGSFYATTHEAGLIVIPSLGWVIFSHFG